MAQNIDFLFNEELRSREANRRLHDITGSCVLKGFELEKGSTDFTVSLTRQGNVRSVAITPSGAKVEEDTDLLDVVAIDPNTNETGLPRIDNIYLVYLHGQRDARATYQVVKGENNNVAPQNPNVNTHLLIGWVRVYPGMVPLSGSEIYSVEKGIAKQEVAGNAYFHGPAEFDQPVIFKSNVMFQDGTEGGGNWGGASQNIYYDTLPTAIIAYEGQENFTLPTTYPLGKNALFVYVDGLLIEKSKVIEVSETTFHLTDPLKAGQKVNAFWYHNLATFTPLVHNHDERYYQKHEIMNRSVHTLQDYFNGQIGRTVVHNLNHTSYDVIAVTPMEKTSSLGTVSVEVGANDIKVYNDGTYRGKFVVSYQVRNSLDYSPTPEQLGQHSVFSKNFDENAGVYRTLEYKRKDGTLYAMSVLSEPNVDNRFVRLTTTYYNTGGTNVIRTEVWALSYDADGRATSKVLQSIT